MALEKDRILVLCTDRDDDLGTKAKMRSPIQGRENVITAAVKLALADPEEADANAIFAAVRRYDELVSEGVECDVAVVCGAMNRGLEADRKLRREVESIVNNGKFTGIVFVSDGGEDEFVIPILQGIRPIVSVDRITVKHSRTVEETYIVLGKYLRMLVFDPRYSKWFLGVPGVMLLLAGILIVSNRIIEAQLATLILLGGAFFVRGFNIDKSIRGILSQRPYGYIVLFSIVTSILVIVVGVSSGFSYLTSQAGGIVNQVIASPALFLVYGTVIIGYFLKGSLALIWVGISIYMIGSLLAHLGRGSIRVWRDLTFLVMLALLYFPIDTFSTFLIGGQRESTILLVSYILVGLAIIFGVTVTIYERIRARGAITRE